MESMRRSLSHMLNRQLSRGYGAWVEMAADRAAFLQKLRKGLSFMLNRQLAAGFAGWRASWDATVADTAMSRALSYFVNRELARGWLGWSSAWEEAVRKRAAIRRSLIRVANHNLEHVMQITPTLEATCWDRSIKRGDRLFQELSLIHI